MHPAPRKSPAHPATLHPPVLDASSPQSFRRDARVIGLVSVAHSISHFFQLALPPLFPLLRAEFDVSWTLLGGLVGVFYAASGIAQFVAGFFVDRMGARPVLLAGMGLRAGGTLIASAAPGVLWLYPIVALMGLGNGVFHPADFAIMNANVQPKRLGHAYSTLAKSEEMPFEELKLDKSFVADCGTDKVNAPLCKTVIDLAHSFGRYVVAVGIEKAADAVALVSMGCDYGQGYLLGQPMPQERFISLLRQRAATQGRNLEAATGAAAKGPA